MLWLPALCSTSGARAISVCDASALAIERALLEPIAAAEHLTAALVADPWLCRWAAAVEPDSGTVHAIATQIAETLVVRLANSAPSPLAWTRTDEQAATDFAAQAASIHAAAVAVLDSDRPAEHSPAYLHAMLFAPAIWVHASGDYLAESEGVDWRLSRLVARLAWFAGLAHDFDHALTRAKLDAMKELAYGASHEINNPLANISGRAQSLLRDERDPRRRRLLASIDAQALRAHEMISDLMLFARPPLLEKVSAKLDEVVYQAISDLQVIATERAITLSVDALPEPAVALFDPLQMLIAIKAVVQNAIDAIGNDGAVTISLRREGTNVVIRVADTGPGISDTVRRHLFDPFFSGREAGRGLGFGLSKCWRIVTLHGGNVKVERTSPAGSVFALRFPATGGEP
ncbi:sensor histidine kinase [Aeoliella sp. SH292]|uniref:sensor histidine kinase n=1 Tax=Aeoliella sp. SH292 TaxID=3454464 RepID=UPI003F988FB9